MSLEKLLKSLDDGSVPEEVQALIDQMQAAAKAEGRDADIHAVQLPAGFNEDDLAFVIEEAHARHRKTCTDCQAKYEREQKEAKTETKPAPHVSSMYKPNFIGYMIFAQRHPDNPKMVPLTGTFTDNDTDAYEMMTKFVNAPELKALKMLGGAPMFEQRAIFTE